MYSTELGERGLEAFEEFSKSFYFSLESER
jgi:hypothetical protein